MEIFNLKSRNILLTGGSSGIGYQAAIQLLEQGSHLTMPCRNIERAKYISSRLSKLNLIGDISNNSFSLPIVDLSDLESIKDFMEKMIQSKSVIDTLVLNAGLQYTGSKQRRLSNDGFELTFAVNHLAHFYLTLLALPLLERSEAPRVVITSSEVHNPKTPGGRIGKAADLGDLSGILKAKEIFMLDGNKIFNADKAYKDSKLCNILFAKELSRRLTEKRVAIPVIAWAPGLVIPRTNDGFFRYSREYNNIGQIVFAFFARDIFRISEEPRRAGEILMELSLSSKYSKVGFSYYSNKIQSYGQHVFEEEVASLESMDCELASNLWDRSKYILGLDKHYL